jgi:hypothetical protein
VAKDGEGAGADEDLDGQDGNGAPSGGPQDGGSENDDKPITAKQLKAALESQKRHYEGQLAGQRAEFEAFKEGVGKQTPAPADKPTVYTKAQLKAAVDAGSITQEQADDQWERQREAELTARAETVALEAVSRQTTQERITSDLSEYKRLKPEIMDPGSETRAKIADEYKYLVETGSAKSVATELAAIRAVLGPLDKLKNASKARRAPEHEEQGGSGGEGKTQKTGNALVDKLDTRWRDHYDKGIKQGRYKDWKEVETELKHAPPQTRARMGLPA